MLSAAVQYTARTLRPANRISNKTEIYTHTHRPCNAHANERCKTIPQSKRYWQHTLPLFLSLCVLISYGDGAATFTHLKITLFLNLTITICKATSVCTCISFFFLQTYCHIRNQFSMLATFGKCSFF